MTASLRDCKLLLRDADSISVAKSCLCIIRAHCYSHHLILNDRVLLARSFPALLIQSESNQGAGERGTVAQFDIRKIFYINHMNIVIDFFAIRLAKFENRNQSGESFLLFFTFPPFLSGSFSFPLFLR